MKWEIGHGSALKYPTAITSAHTLWTHSLYAAAQRRLHCEGGLTSEARAAVGLSGKTVRFGVGVREVIQMRKLPRL